MDYKNIHLHNEIRSWNTEQLIETLEFNGLGECCDAISMKQIDGEEFLNLSEGQLSLWRNVLNVTQSRRLWSLVQLAKERPQNFVINGGQLSQQKNPAQSQQSRPTVNRNVPAALPTKPHKLDEDVVQRKQAVNIRSKVPALPKPPIFNQTDELFSTKEPINNCAPALNQNIVAALQVKINNEYPMSPTPNRPPLIRPVKPAKSEEDEPATEYSNFEPEPKVKSPMPNRPPVALPAANNFGSDRKAMSPFAANLNSLLSQQLTTKDETAPSAGIEGNYPKHVLQRKASIASTGSTDSLSLPPKPPSRQPSPVPPEVSILPKSPSVINFRPMDMLPNPSHLHTLPKASSIERPSIPKPPTQKHDSSTIHFATLSKSRMNIDSSDFIAPPLPTRPSENSLNQLSRSQQSLLPPSIRPNNSPLLYPNVTIDTPANPRPMQFPSWAGSRPLPSPPQNDPPFMPSSEPMRNETSPMVGRKTSNCCDNLPRPPAFALQSVDIEVDYEMPLEDEDAEYYFVDETDQHDYRIQSWYKNVERKEANMLLRGQPNGSFLVRPSKQHECCFSVICERRVYNIAVSKEGAKFVMGKSTFDNIQEIVDRFTDHPLVLNGPNNTDLPVTLRRN